MQFIKNKIPYLILLAFLLYVVYPINSLANEETSYVWSEISNPAIETVSSINQDKRKFFKFNLWKCYFNRPVYWQHFI